MRRGICLLAAAAGAAFAGTGDGSAGRPPALALTTAPARTTDAVAATFRWTVPARTRTVCRVTRSGASEAAIRSRRAALFKRCSSPARWSRLAPGRHAFVLLAIRGGRITGRIVYRWTIRGAAVAPGTSPAPPSSPPAPPARVSPLQVSFTSTPPSTTTLQTATFTWAVSDPKATVTCSVDSGSWQACTPPKTLTLALGTHTFAVRASTVVTSVTSTYSWTIASPTKAGCATAPYRFLSPVHPELSAAEKQFVDLVNQARASLGLSALQVNAQLNLAADSHSYWQDVALGTGLSHTGCGNSDPGDRIADAGYRASAWGEVTLIRKPPASALTAFNMFKNSPGHWAILTSASMKEIGVGAGTYHWTGDLGSQ